MYCLFVKQKTAYELRNSDWSSDVCSYDLGSACGLSTCTCSATVVRTTSRCGCSWKSSSDRPAACVRCRTQALRTVPTIAVRPHRLRAWVSVADHQVRRLVQRAVGPQYRETLAADAPADGVKRACALHPGLIRLAVGSCDRRNERERKSTRLNSSH